MQNGLVTEMEALISEYDEKRFNRREFKVCRWLSLKRKTRIRVQHNVGTCASRVYGRISGRGTRKWIIFLHPWKFITSVLAELVSLCFIQKLFFHFQRAQVLLLYNLKKMQRQLFKSLNNERMDMEILGINEHRDTKFFQIFYLNWFY